MRALPKVALGGGIVSVTAVAGLLASGVLATTATLVVTDPAAPPANADALQRFDDCAQLLDWYVDHAVHEVGAYGWDGPVRPGVMLDNLALTDTTDGLRMPSAASQPIDGRAASATGTNTQEADVDEPDVAKTDGTRVVRLARDRTLVVTDVSGAEPRELARMPLPVHVLGSELLLAGDHVLVSAYDDQWNGSRPGPLVDDVNWYRAGDTRIIDVDISDASHPRVVHDDTYNGSLVSLRLYGDTVRLVTSTSRPELAWVMPHDPKTGRLSEREATRRNRALVRATTIEDWLPSVVDNRAPSSGSRLLGCDDVYHPRVWSGAGTATVATYDVHDPLSRHAVAVTADGELVYSSADRLYVASTEFTPQAVARGRVTGEIPMPIRPHHVTTELHAFALDGTDTHYIGSGHVDGSVRDRWSLDEHGGKLRVAWSRERSGTIRDRNGESRARSENGITILSERDGALVPTGEVADLGIDETIQSVRWFDDFAVLVTFRQMDPLYTIDLRDQDHPRALGHLKIPGYSGYLHPIGGDRLLGLGVDATSQGRSLGTQAAVFDVADLTGPRRISRQAFGPDTELPALDDPREFTWLPDRQTGITTVAGWSRDQYTGDQYRARLVALHVSTDGSLAVRDLAAHAGWSARTLPLADGRIAVVDERGVRVLDLG